jgi:hypothetical protein
MCELFVEYDEDRAEAARGDFADFDTACVEAIHLADALGNAPGDGHGPPRWVSVYRQGKLKIRISIIRGGMLGETGDQTRPTTS